MSVMKAILPLLISASMTSLFFDGGCSLCGPNTSHNLTVEGLYRADPRRVTTNQRFGGIITLIRFKEKRETEKSEVQQTEAQFLDLQTYPRRSKQVLWIILRRYGLRGTSLEIITEERFPTSPALFNLYNQTAIIIADRERRKQDNKKKRL